MNKEEQILIKDEQGRVFLTIKFDGPFVAEKKFSATLFPKTKEELVIPKEPNFTFKCTFDAKGIDMVPLATLATWLMTYPQDIKVIDQRLQKDFVLGHFVSPTKYINKAPVKRPPSRLPEDHPCHQKIALLVTGDCSWWIGEDLIMAEADRDMKANGYATQSLVQPTIDQFEKALSNPCVKALVIIGHGTDGDSTAGTHDNAKVSLVGDGNNALHPTNLTSLGVPNVPLELFILHSCFQGCPNNEKAWKTAAGGKKTAFTSWKNDPTSFEVYMLQKAI